MKRKCMRLKDFDYSQNGGYFITVCSRKREKIFGDIVGAGLTRPCDKPEIILSEAGSIIQQYINDIPLRYRALHITNYVIMPNHVHLLIID